MVMNLSNERKGLVLVTGSAGSGKSTTLACIIDKINHSRKSHVITLEDPLEFLHQHDQSGNACKEIKLSLFLKNKGKPKWFSLKILLTNF